MSAISGMTKIQRCSHFRNVAANEIGTPAEAAAGKDQRVAADPLVRAIRSNDLDSEDAATGIRRKPLGGALCEDGDIVCFSSVAQTVNQLPTCAARQPVHAHG